MTTLTKEYFDERLDEVHHGLQKEIQDLAAMTARCFAGLERHLDVRERVEKLEEQMAKVGSALNVRL